MSALTLRSPFIIGPRLRPALRLGDAILSLERIDGRGERQRAVLLLDIGGEEYRIDDLYSGTQGFRSAVEPFSSLLSFMGACAEAVKYAQRTGTRGENADLFVPAVAQWCGDHASEIDCARCEIEDEQGNGRHELITGDHWTTRCAKATGEST